MLDTTAMMVSPRYSSFDGLSVGNIEPDVPTLLAETCTAGKTRRCSGHSTLQGRHEVAPASASINKSVSYHAKSSS